MSNSNIKNGEEGNIFEKLEGITNKMEVSDLKTHYFDIASMASMVVDWYIEKEPAKNFHKEILNDTNFEGLSLPKIYEKGPHFELYWEISDLVKQTGIITSVIIEKLEQIIEEAENNENNDECSINDVFSHFLNKDLELISELLHSSDVSFSKTDTKVVNEILWDKISEDVKWDLFAIMNCFKDSVESMLEVINTVLASRKSQESKEFIKKHWKSYLLDEQIHDIYTWEREDIMGTDFYISNRLMRSWNIFLEDSDVWWDAIKKSLEWLFSLTIEKYYFWEDETDSEFVPFDWVDYTNLEEVLSKLISTYPELTLERFREFSDISNNRSWFIEKEYDFYIQCKSEEDCVKKIQSWHGVNIKCGFIWKDKL